jgi:hypothetical protein
VSRRVRFGKPDGLSLPSYKNAIFVTKRLTLTFPQWESDGQATEQEVRGREMCVD